MIDWNFVHHDFVCCQKIASLAIVFLSSKLGSSTLLIGDTEWSHEFQSIVLNPC